MSLLEYVLNKYIAMGEKYNQVLLLYPCSPLLKVNHLVESSNLFEIRNSLMLVMSVCEYSVPIEWAYEIINKKELNPINLGTLA